MKYSTCACRLIVELRQRGTERPASTWEPLLYIPRDYFQLYLVYATSRASREFRTSITPTPEAPHIYFQPRIVKIAFGEGLLYVRILTILNAITSVKFTFNFTTREFCFVDRASQYNLVNKANLVHNLSLCVDDCPVCRLPGIPDSHPHRVTNSKCRIDTIILLMMGT
jgi:hypothetical protein